MILVVGGFVLAAPQKPDTYSVQAQDTLYSIAWRHNLDFRDLAKWNNLNPDFHIIVGQLLKLSPGMTARPAARLTPPRPPVETSPLVKILPSIKFSPPISHVPSPVEQGSAVTANVHWVWPTVRNSRPLKVPGGGIFLTGKLGQDIRAGCAGRVVYAGNGIRGYGNLVIIKHGDNLLSAYAHNRELLVQEGKVVSAGEVIAHMGEGPHHKTVLYFEIRRNGKPVDPLTYLRN